MAITTLPQQSSTTTVASNNQSYFDIFKNNVSEPCNWVHLIPVIATLALGVIFVPNIPIGIAIGIGSVALAGVADFANKKWRFVPVFVPFSSAEPSQVPHVNIIEKMMANKEDRPLLLSYGTLIGPIVEEGIFRGILQPLATRAILWIIPAAAAAFLGPSLSVAMTVSIVATAVIFGLCHYFQTDGYHPFQGMLTTLDGIAYGLVAAQFGLPAAMTVHIVANTIIATSMALLGNTPNPNEGVVVSTP